MLHAKVSQKIIFFTIILLYETQNFTTTLLSWMYQILNILYIKNYIKNYGQLWQVFKIWYLGFRSNIFLYKKELLTKNACKILNYINIYLNLKKRNALNFLYFANRISNNIHNFNIYRNPTHNKLSSTNYLPTQHNIQKLHLIWYKG